MTDGGPISLRKEQMTSSNQNKFKYIIDIHSQTNKSSAINVIIPCYQIDLDKSIHRLLEGDNYQTYCTIHWTNRLPSPHNQISTTS